MNKYFLFPIALTTLALTACSDDDDKYASKPPILTDIVATPLTPGATELKAGERILLKAVQRNKGRLLNATKYNWSSTSEQISHRYPATAIYDNEPIDATDTIIVSNPGSYQVSFTARYNASGDTGWWANKYGSSFTEYFPDGLGRATYITGGLLYFEIIAEKKIFIK